MGILGWPLGWVMWLFYLLTNNYGISLLLFTIFFKVVLFPLSIKQQKSSIKMQLFQPQIKQLQDKYKNNKEKLQEETMKLYEREHYNPMSGCLPMFIQFPILFGLIDVISHPLKHILRFPEDVVNKGIEIMQTLGLVTDQQIKGGRVELMLINELHAAPQKFAELGSEIVAKINNMDLNFLGMNLGDTPSTSMFTQMFNGGWNPVALIPILSGVTALLVSMISMKYSPTATDAASSSAGMKGMMYAMPLMSVWIAFSQPAGVGLYWVFNNLTSMLQSVLLNKFYNPKEMAEKAKAEYEEKKTQERQQRIEEKKEAKETGETDKGLSQKEINRRKLAEARKRDAEKYGEEYVEVTDDEL